MTWTKFIEDNYDNLVRMAGGMTHSPNDLVHHCYLRVYEKDVENKENYFHRTMWLEVTDSSSKFYKGYKYFDSEFADVQNLHDLSDKITKERIDFMLCNFNPFQRKIYQLWREGYNMSEVSRESGVPRRTIDYTIHKVKEFLKNHI